MKLEQHHISQINDRINQLYQEIENYKIDIRRNLKKFTKTKLIKYAADTTRCEIEIIKKERKIERFREILRENEEKDV